MANPFIALLEQIGRHPASDAAATSDVAAVFSVHGMGQQVRFDTLQVIAEALNQEHFVRNGKASSHRTVIVQAGDKKLIRTEMTLEGKEVHLYEGYWAPLTEGRVTLKDAFDFLLGAGLSGWRLARKEKVFRRWVFGEMRQMPESNVGRLAFLFVFIIFELFGLAIINAGLIALAAGNMFGAATNWPPPALQQDVAMATLLYLVPAVCLGITLWIQSARYRAKLKSASTYDAWQALRKEKAGQSRQLMWTWIWLSLLGIIAAAAMFVIEANLHKTNAPSHLDIGGIVIARSALPAVVALVLGLSVLVAALVRSWLIQYVGDLAAYISAHKVSKFAEIREAIQAQACDVARAIYTMRASASNAPLYSRFVAVGHSLGSVIVYDALNSVFNDYLLARSEGGKTLDPFDPISRTRLLLTCGSPLDKTAYIFRSQAGSFMDVREAAAAQVQPMILDERLRPFPWINIWSNQDPISGPLDFYDFPPDRPNHVHNWMDVQASLPFASHSQYFDHPLLRDTLFEAATGGTAKGPDPLLSQPLQPPVPVA